jgi:hypothetical protein
MQPERAVDRKARVFVLEQQPFDYSPAKAYGELVFLNTKKLAPASTGAPDTWNNDVVHSLRKELSDYISDIDYIIPTGSPSRMVTVGAVLASKGKRHRILGWDARTQRYLEYIINI